MKMKYTVLFAALASALFGVPGHAASTAASSSNAAGTANANNAGIGTSSSGSYSGSSAGSVANGGSGTAIGTGGTGGYAGSNVTFTYNDPPAADPSSTQTERLITTGTAIAPSIYSNNVCALSASAAGGFFGGAFALGFDRVDRGCDLRATASLLGHFAEIYSIAAAHAPDAQTRQLAVQQAVTYATWANNLLCMQDPDLAAAAPPGSNICRTVATQQGMQVVPAPVAYTVPPKQMVVAAAPAPIADPPPKPVYTGPHVYATHEVVPTSMRSGPVSGYQGPDYSDDE